jgi:hypothetical protein
MRKYRRFHGVLLIRILGAFVFGTDGLALLPVPDPVRRRGPLPPPVFIQLAVSAALLGAFARCPVCRAESAPNATACCRPAVVRAGLSSMKAPAIWGSASLENRTRFFLASRQGMSKSPLRIGQRCGVHRYRIC